MNPQCYTMMNAAAGVVATTSGFYITFMEHVEISLRVGTAATALVIGVLTVRNLLRKK